MRAQSRWRDHADDLSETVKIAMLLSEYTLQKYPEGGYGRAQNLARHARKLFKERF